MNLNKLGFIVGVLALVLAVPLAVFANLLTPSAQVWYSTTSLNRLRKRITKLTTKLEKEPWVFTPAEWEAFYLSSLRTQIIYFSMIGVYYLLFGIFILVVFIGAQLQQTLKFNDISASDRHFLVLVLLFGMAALVAVAVVTYYETFRYVRNKRWHTTKGRGRVQKEIDKLRLILSQREQTPS